MVSRQIKVSLNSKTHGPLLQVLRESSFGAGKSDAELVSQTLYAIYYMHLIRNENGLNINEFIRRYFTGADRTFEQQWMRFNHNYAEFLRSGLPNLSPTVMKVRDVAEYPPGSWESWCPCRMKSSQATHIVVNVHPAP